MSNNIHNDRKTVRISGYAYDYFQREINRRKLARKKPDTLTGIIDEMVTTEIDAAVDAREIMKEITK